MSRFCQVDGLGTVGSSAPGSYGPEAGSIVEASGLEALIQWIN